MVEDYLVNSELVILEIVLRLGFSEIMLFYWKFKVVIGKIFGEFR